MPENGRYLSPIAAEVADDVLDRFLRYVRIDTQSDFSSTTYPSTANQRELGELLARELQGLGLEDARIDEHGYVFGTLPGTSGPTVGLIAHVDTSPDESGANVKPQVVRNYDGGEIPLPGNPRQALGPSDSALLAQRVGHDIVTTDGTTLLGADDKAGVAEIMAAVAYLVRHPEIEHAPIRIAFTVDEEIGKGVDHFDIAAFGADFAYTLDGAEVGQIDDETFAASEVRVRIEGHSVHPGTSKGKMVNSIKLAAALLEQLPKDRLSPETTEAREGFVHPARIVGGTAETTITFIARDFDRGKLKEHEQLLRDLADGIVRDEPRARVTVEVDESYRNMKEYLDAWPRISEAADEATRRVGLQPSRNAIRGGTDGAMLSARGLLTPNIFTGGQEYHSVREWISVQDMALSTATIVELAKLWAEPEWAG
ncbi:MAG TPA: peptidase T [Gaiellaceae bacterium]|nr:peptidase T [Gaiellaceae bacterium]